MEMKTRIHVSSSGKTYVDIEIEDIGSYHSDFLLVQIEKIKSMVRELNHSRGESRD